MQYQAFTLKSDAGLLRELKTECGVSVAFDTNSGQPHPPVKKYIGLWDTGATGSVITKRVAEELGLISVGKARVCHANGECTVDQYFINLLLPNSSGVQVLKVTEGILNGFDVLIGMDVICNGDFCISNFNNKTTFTFRIPSVQEIDFVAQHNSHTPVAVGKKVGRNDQCPCNSGKKYKQCCGRN